MKILLLILSQCVFSFSRTLNIRYAAKEHPWKYILTGLVIKAAWLLSAYLGVTAMIKQDLLTITVFIIGGVLGDYFSFKIKV